MEKVKQLFGPEATAWFDPAASLQTGLRLLGIWIGLWIVWIICKRALKTFQSFVIAKEKRGGGDIAEIERRSETLVRFSTKTAGIALSFLAVLVSLGELGFKIGPLIASAGFAGVAIGFGAQSLVKDVISGFFIILDGQIRVGDVAKVNEVSGTIETIGLRAVSLRDVEGTVHYFQNGSISSLSNSGRDWGATVLDLGVAYNTNLGKLFDILKEVEQNFREDPEWSEKILEPMEVFGLNNFGDSALVVRVRLKTKPLTQWEVGRELRKRIKESFDQNNIEIPFPTRTLVQAGS